MRREGTDNSQRIRHLSKQYSADRDLAGTFKAIRSIPIKTGLRFMGGKATLNADTEARRDYITSEQVRGTGIAIPLRERDIYEGAVGRAGASIDVSHDVD